MSGEQKYQARWTCAKCGREFVEQLEEAELLFWVGVEEPPVCIECDPDAKQQIVYLPAGAWRDVATG